ncbi:MAG TPA: asparagine synthase-related protein [Thermohalobaculum sp.]|nr:asparagine synthase-related protein [Thermohalobaculum sp.]
MIVQVAGIVALDGAEPPEARLEAMLGTMNPRRRPAAMRSAAHGPARFGAIAIASGGAPAGPPPLLADEAGLFVADARLWEAPTAGPGGATDDVARIATRIRGEGAAASARLHGDFAWARWDGRALELARDHFGVRPLYYAVRPGRWAAFASHPGALIEAGLARPALDLAAVQSLALTNAPPAGRFYQTDIATQLPGHLTRIDPAGRVETRRYWRLPIGPRLSERTDPREISAEMRRLLEQAVQRRLPASGPAGGHLSGGIDSSPIAVIAARAIRAEGRRFFGYSLEESAAGLDFEPVDEACYVAEVVAAEANIEHVAVPDPSAIEPYLGAYDGALLEPAGEPEHRILAHAEAAGLGSLFSGWGGDQIASFPADHVAAELFIHGRWGMLLRELRRFRARLPTSLYYKVLLPLLGQPWRRRVERLTGRGLPPPKTLPDFRPAGRRPGGPPGLDLPPPGRSFLARREAAERNWIQHRLARFAHLGAPYGVRYAYPLLDLDLVGFAMRVPAWFLARPGESRCLLRDAIRGLVPERVRLRQAKLFPHSLDTLRLPRLGARIDARLAALAPDGLAATAIDIAALRAAYREALDTPEATLARMREHAARGEQLFLEAFTYTFALQVALALDQYERRHGAAAYPSELAPGSTAPPDPARTGRPIASRA